MKQYKKVVVLVASTASGLATKINDYYEDNKIEVVDVQYQVMDKKYTALVQYVLN